MKLADRIRDHAIKNYIEPARKKQRSIVMISAREIHDGLKLTSRFPAVCSALDTDKFKEQARIIEQTREGPNQSSTVIWKFEILP